MSPSVYEVSVAFEITAPSTLSASRVMEAVRGHIVGQVDDGDGATFPISDFVITSWVPNARVRRERPARH